MIPPAAWRRMLANEAATSAASHYSSRQQVFLFLGLG